MKRISRACTTTHWIVLLALTLLSTILDLSPSAHAIQIIPNGPPRVTGSWTQIFDIIDGNFDMAEMFIVADGGGGPFEAPGLENILDLGGAGGSWTASLVNPGYILASEPSGTDTFWLNGDLHFAGDISLPVTFDILFYQDGFDDGTFDLRLAYDRAGRFFSDSIPAGNTYDRAPVPESATILLLGSGLVGLVGINRKRRTKQR